MMGTGPFAVPTFESLVAAEHDVVVLVTRPMPPMRTRGKPPINPMRDAAGQHGIEVIAPDDVNSEGARTQLAALRPDLFVVCDYGQILSPDTLAITPLGGINLHGSLLPKYRGAAPVQWAIFNGDAETGVTVIHMTPQLDAGPCLVTRSTPIGDDETHAELEPRLADLGVGAVHEAIRLLDDWDGESTVGVAQDQSLASRAPRLKKSDGNIDWTKSAKQIHNQIRAFKPWPGSFTQWVRSKGEPVRLIVDQVLLAKDQPADSPPGTIIQINEVGIHVSTGEGVLVIQTLQPAGKRMMDVGAFLRGHQVAIGDVLGA
jgi:methionyl-tRNA formyltransferase